MTMTNAKWEEYTNFKKSEFDCKETGENEMQHDFMIKLQELRTRYNYPVTITSGYRSPNHSIEAKKNKPGVHSSGWAADIAVNRRNAHRLLTIALELGFTGIGVQQKDPDFRFLHLDCAPSLEWPRPTIWSY